MDAETVYGKNFLYFLLNIKYVKLDITLFLWFFASEALVLDLFPASKYQKIIIHYRREHQISVIKFQEHDMVSPMR